MRPGEKHIIDIDVNRPIYLDLKDFWFAGDYGGDKLVVSYLEEADEQS